MKITKQLFLVVSALVIAACSPVKKSAASSASAARVSTPTPASDDYLFTKHADGISAPGDAELIAIQALYKDVTLEKLKDGHFIYTQGACVNCHNAKNIYQLEEANWKNILEDMAQKAAISDVQKDAVYKYVLSIKATQPK